MGRRREIREERKKAGIKSGISIFDDHNGFHPGKMHLLLARTSSGKSTMVRSLVRGICINHKVFYLCTEESIEDVVDGFGDLNDEEAYQVEKNVSYRHENDLPKDPMAYWQFVAQRVLDTKAEMFVFDNLTASRMYDGLKPQEQGKFCDLIFDMTKAINVPTLVIAHTSKDIKNNDFTVESIRGSQNIILRSEYAYSLHSDRVEAGFEGRSISKIETWVKVGKARQHGNSLMNTYKLEWDHDKRLFFGATQKPMDDFNSFIRPRRTNAKKPSTDV